MRLFLFKSFAAVMLFTLAYPLTAVSQENQDKEKDKNPYSSLKFRSIGPAFTSGRIADIAIDPVDENTWYVAVGSGGVWKTVNAGVTWIPLFDSQTSYSIGCVSIDPGNHNTIWAGTGENVGGRHAGYGDGVYRSDDGGSTWKNMGLPHSEHISKIIIHPSDPNIIWVASQGPLWSAGGERGIYKSTDGGKTWKRTLGDDEYMGATDLVIDPRNPDRLYAAAWERHRNVAAYIGGGPGSGIYRSEDGGETWIKLSKGLPQKDMGKIGIALSPQKPDVVYAAIELERRTGGVFRSEDRGASWKMMSNTVSGATGPHYYQELYASPHAFDRIYLADVRMQVSDDGGTTFRKMKEEAKHSDNHALAFRASDPDYLLVGTDGGLYESFDLEANWRFINNLPVTQYYKIALDDALPFYNIYGGTQDNSSHGGPSRTASRNGITNSDWRIVLGADGHQPATEPGNPDIIYAESQEGFLHRIDVTTGERMFIQPQHTEDDGGYERFNWDAPILVSPHSPSRIYYGSQRVWRSDDRGNSWQAISGDLTRNQDRMSLPVSGKTWGWESAWDLYAMSTFNTITSLAESPLQEGLIYAGTDDGLIQVTTDGGSTWRKTEVSSLPGAPDEAFVNDIKADLFDANTVYVLLDAHKYGIYQPYVYRSTDLGKSWKRMDSGLPTNTIAWRIVQDHVDARLFFLATEFGVYFTNDAGETWIQLKGGLPTISFRDLAIQRRDNDLVAASFGRGIYILDDFSVLRHTRKEDLEQEALLFPVRDAWWYIEKMTVGHERQGNQGASYFTADNPPFGALISYYLKEPVQGLEASRKAEEKKMRKAGEDLNFPGWDALEAERMEAKPGVWLLVTDMEGQTVRWIRGEGSKGFHRIAWDLRYAPSTAIGGAEPDPWEEHRGGILAVPGSYQVSLYRQRDGKMELLSGPEPFEVKAMGHGALPSPGYDEAAAFWKEADGLRRGISAAVIQVKAEIRRVQMMNKALALSTTGSDAKIRHELDSVQKILLAAEDIILGNRLRASVGEKAPLGLTEKLGNLTLGIGATTYGPTPALSDLLQDIKTEYEALRISLNEISEEVLPAIEAELEAAGAPWTPGQELPAAGLDE